MLTTQMNSSLCASGLSDDLSRRRSVLYVANEDWFFWAHAGQLARAARDAGFEVYVLARANRDQPQFAHEGFNLIPWKVRRRSLNPLLEASALAQVVAVSRELRPSLIHALSLKQVTYGGIAGRVNSIPTLGAITGLGHVFAAQTHSMKLLRNTVLSLLRFSQRGKDAVLTVENADDLELLTRAKVVPADRVILVRGAGVDTEFHQPQAEPGGIPVVALASRLLWYKGVGDFVEAASILRGRGVQARFALIGDVDAENPSSVPAELLTKWNDSGNVEVWGRYSDMREAFRKVHIVCLPTFYREGIPKVLLEAAASGKPIVTTDTPGCRDIVRQSGNGTLVPPRDPLALASALEVLIADRELRQKYGQCGRRRAVSEFRMQIVVDKTLGLYEALTANSNSHASPVQHSLSAAAPGP